MNTIWVVEVGNYSDYRVAGVFTTEEKAKVVYDRLLVSNSHEDPVISEWPLDPGVDEMNQGMSIWRCVMGKNGHVEQTHQQPASDRLYTEFRVIKRSEHAYYGPDAQDVLEAKVWATDKDHAIKIVNEKRTELIAMNKWIHE